MPRCSDSNSIQRVATCNIAPFSISRAPGPISGPNNCGVTIALQPDFDRPSVDGHFEENIAALGARLDREAAYAADAAQRPARLNKAAEHYEAIYRRTASTFLGINAAVLHEMSGDPARAQEIAMAIVGQCAKSKPQSQDDAYQLAADRAAASLLLDDLDDTRAAIEEAALLSSSAAAIASTRKQLIQICNHKRLDRSIVAPLRNRAIIHYTGHIIAPEGSRRTVSRRGPKRGSPPIFAVSLRAATSATATDH